MKNYYLLFLSLITSCTSALAQGKATVATEIEPTRKIEVYGDAQQDVEPDIFYVSVILREYEKSDSVEVDSTHKELGVKKVSIQSLEKKIIDAAGLVQILPDQIVVKSLPDECAFNIDRFKPKVCFARKSYQLVFSELGQMYSVLCNLDKSAVEIAMLDRYDYSKKQDILKALRAKAMQSAKDKAVVLLKSIGEELDSVIEVQELPVSEAANLGHRQELPLVGCKTRGQVNQDASSSVKINKLNIQYKVRTVFEVQ